MTDYLRKTISNLNVIRDTHPQQPPAAHFSYCTGICLLTSLSRSTCLTRPSLSQVETHVLRTLSRFLPLAGRSNGHHIDLHRTTRSHEHRPVARSMKSFHTHRHTELEGGFRLKNVLCFLSFEHRIRLLQQVYVACVFAEA